MVPEPGNPQGLNRYAYVNNNPVRYTDPSGHCPWCIAVGVGALIGAGVSYGTQVAVNISQNGLNVQAFTDVNWKQVGAGAVAGAVGVATFGVGTAVLGTGFIATAASGAVSSVVADQAAIVTKNVLNGEKVTKGVGSADDIVQDAAIGVLLAGGGKAVSKVISAWSVETPYGTARQSLSPRALWLRYKIGRGASIFRGGQFGHSSAVEGQFWAPENPLSPGYEAKYGVAFDQLEWIFEGTIKPGARFVTRPAPPYGNNPGGAIEVVVESMGVHIRGFYMR